MSKFGYELFAETREYLAVNSEIVRNWIEIMFQRGCERLDSILDIATGIGTMVRLFLEQLPHGCDQPAVFCLDSDPEALKEVRSRLARKVARLELLHCPAQQIDLTDHSVDIAIWGNGIHYLNQSDQVQSLGEIKRVLRPKGWLFFNTAFHAESRPAETLPFYKAQIREAARLLHSWNVKGDKSEPRSKASHFLPKLHYEKLILEAGFMIQEAREYVGHLNQTAWEHINSFPQYAAGALHGLPVADAIRALQQAVAPALEKYGLTDQQGGRYIPRKWLALSALAP